MPDTETLASLRVCACSLSLPCLTMQKYKNVIYQAAFALKSEFFLQHFISCRLVFKGVLRLTRLHPLVTCSTLSLLEATFVICWYTLQTAWTQIRTDRSVLIWTQTDWHSNLVPVRSFFKKKLIMQKVSRWQQKHGKLPSMQRVKCWHNLAFSFKINIFIVFMHYGNKTKTRILKYTREGLCNTEFTILFYLCTRIPTWEEILLRQLSKPKIEIRFADD